MQKITLLIVLIVFVVSPVAFSEFAICKKPGNQMSPNVSGDIVIWEDDRNSLCGQYDIYGYDLKTGTEFEVCVAGGQQYESSIGGGFVVWSDWRNGQRDIYGYDIQKELEFLVSEYSSYKGDPATDGSFVYWSDERDGNGDIYVYNISTGEESLLFADPNWQRHIDVDGNNVVWDNFKDVNGIGVDKKIQGYNLNTNESFMVCKNTDNQISPAVSGDVVVWSSNGDIYGCSLESEDGEAYPICTAQGQQVIPDIDSNIVVWTDYRNGDADIYGYNLTYKEEFIICSKPGVQGCAKISGNVVVWSDESDIYATILVSKGDFFNSAIQVHEAESYEGSTSDATGIDVTDDGYKDYVDVWHVFVPDEDGLYFVSLCGSNFDTTLSVFDEKRIEIEFNDNFCGLQSALILRAKAGRVYNIRVAGYDGDRGDYKLSITKDASVFSGHDSNYDGIVDFSDFSDFAKDWLKNN